ncbi:MAG: lysylphosphatidylglycerol synthase transmembrane domain-containing protein [Bacillota bacterium]
MSNKTHTMLFVLGLIILGFLIWDFGISNIILNIRKLSWWFLVITAIWGVVYLINALAWYIILGKDREKVSFARVFGIGISGFAINYITPFVNLGGEPYRVSALRNSLGIEKAISAVTLYRMVHILAHLIFWLCIIPVSFIVLPKTAGLTALLTGIFAAVLFLIIFFFSRHRKGIFEAILNLLKVVPFLKFISRRIEKYRDSIIVIDGQIKDLFNRRKGSFYSALFLEYISRFVASVEFFVVLGALGINISFSQAFFIHAASSLFLNIFFFMPLEMGTREGSLFLVFQAFNFNPEISIFVGLVNRTRELFWILIGIFLIQINNKKTKGLVNSNLTEDPGSSYEGNNI